jgi:hypothetical protein
MPAAQFLGQHGDKPMRHFMLKKKAILSRADWLNRTTVYEGKLISMVSRVVRLYAPNPADTQPHVDLSYDWVMPVH